MERTCVINYRGEPLRFSVFYHTLQKSVLSLTYTEIKIKLMSSTRKKMEFRFEESMRRYLHAHAAYFHAPPMTCETPFDVDFLNYGIMKLVLHSVA